MTRPARVERPERNGQQLERTVAAILREAGAESQSQVVIGPGAYGDPWRVDFLIRNATEYPCGLVLECRWQESNGSADEKFPLLVANIRTLPCPAIIVAAGLNARGDGQGARPSALRWLQRAVDGKHLLAVLTVEQLMPWMRRLTYTRSRLF